MGAKFTGKAERALNRARENTHGRILTLFADQLIPDETAETPQEGRAEA